MTELIGHEGPNRRRPSAVVTGASAGVGRATALALAARGYEVGLIARDEEGLREVADGVEALGARALVLPCDVADAAAVRAAADRVAEQFGGIDAWVNSAMATVFARVDDITPEEFRRVTEVTYLGQVNGTLAALAHMRPADRGTIVQVGSALAYRSIPLQSAYCAAKHAVVGFTKSLRTELLSEGSGIRVAMVHLPAVNTPQFAWARAKMGVRPRPAGRPVAPEVAGRAIAEAAAHPRPEIYLGRSTVMAILGDAALPGLADHVAAGAWEGQLTDTPLPEREGNLFAPVSGVRRDRGPFAEEAGDWAPRVSARATRIGLMLGAAALFGLTAAVARALDRR
ncbi:SDR family oxidoreductase [Amaricoccus solimangrovi]|uniref:SDR family NAD(P)-dependent oxidoreductase n=1 Tax=Amaricoccus solimangrovi TaxID=2589815 RepID=A0A501WQ85_9RHOB|nr:SDR family oxidoreductase [Amaricoccus solimangrovi]TPE50254.1 SDR family NAD(P)-dependent oxidoreductase [Amaricoccus solimangrovi]